jgi:ATP-dependent Zn protease
VLCASLGAASGNGHVEIPASCASEDRRRPSFPEWISTGDDGRKLMPRSDARDERIIYHELGHAILHRAFGNRVEFITIEPFRESDGRLVNGRCRWTSDGLDAFYRCAVNVAGATAEEVFLVGPGKLRGSDRANAMQHARELYETEDGIADVIRAAKAEAERILVENRALVEALAAELRVRRTMSGSEIEACIADAEAAKVAALWLSCGVLKPPLGLQRPRR